MKKSEIVLGKKVKIQKGAVVLGQCRFGDNCQVSAGSVLEDVVLGDNCQVFQSQIKGSNFGKNCQIGPFAHVRENCVVGDNVKVGAFVELKEAIVGSGCKMAHLAYVGDAELGENVNVGCGVVFANYDGKTKHKSKVGSNVFIGCNVNIVAPVTISDQTYICAGTTVTEDTKCGDFVIGRVKQENKKRKNQ